MSRSRSSQASTVTNTNINNVLDGGAIKSSFDFADGLAQEAFDSVDHAVDVTKSATQTALKENSHVTEEALDTNKQVIQSALERFQEQNNRSLDALAGLQGTQASNNYKLLDGIQKTIRNDNSGGASEILESQKTLYLVMGALLLVVFIVFAFKQGK